MPTGAGLHGATRERGMQGAGSLSRSGMQCLTDSNGAARLVRFGQQAVGFVARCPALPLSVQIDRSAFDRAAMVRIRAIQSAAPIATANWIPIVSAIIPIGRAPSGSRPKVII
jgi:hypothetical protein